MERLAEQFRAVTAGRTQEEIADRLRVDQTTVSRLLRGDHRLGRKLASALVREWPELREAVADAFLASLEPCA